MSLSFEQFNELRKKGLTPEQIAKFESGYKPTSQQPQGLGGVLGVTKGLGKSVVSTFQGMASLGEKGLRGTVGRLFGDTSEDIKAPTSAESMIPKNLTDAQGGAEKFGKFVGDVAQFAIPGSGAYKATKGANLAMKLGTRALTSAGVASLQEGEVGKEAGIAAGFEVVAPGVSKAASVPLKIFNRLLSGTGAALSGVARPTLKDVISDPQTAKTVSETIKKSGTQNILTENAKIIRDGISKLRQGARADYGKALEKLSTVDIKVPIIRDNLKSVLKNNKITTGQGRFNLSNSEILDEGLQKKATIVLNKINSLTKANGKQVRNMLDSLEASKFKSALDPNRQAFNNLMTDLSKGLRGAVEKSTNKLEVANAKYSSVFDLTDAMERIFGKVKFKNTSELNQIARKLENLGGLKELDEKTLTKFLSSIGVEEKPFRASEAVRQIYRQDVGANTMGINRREIAQQISAAVITPEMVKNIAVFTGMSKGVIDEIIKKTSPTVRATILKAIIDSQNK